MLIRSRKFTSGVRRSVRIAVAAVVIAVVSLLHGIGILKPFEHRLYDLRINVLSALRPPSNDILMLAIDDESLRRLEPAVGRWPWPRSVMATVIDYCSGAKTIAFDVLYAEGDWQYGGSDELLSLTAMDSSNVVCGIYLDRTPQDTSEVRSLEAFEFSPARAGRLPDLGYQSVIAPFAGLREASRGLGHVNAVIDDDGVTRSYSVAARVKSKLYPSLAAAAVMHFKGVPIEQAVLDGDAGVLTLGDLDIPFDPAGNVRILPSKWAFETKSIVDVIQAWQEETEGRLPSLRRSRFDDKLVVIGFTAVGLRSDTTITSMASRSGGVNVHMTAMDNMLNEWFVRTAPEWLTYSLIALFTLLMIAPSLGKPSIMVPGALLIALLYLVVVMVGLFSLRMMLPVLAPMLGIAGVSAGLTSIGWFRDRSRTRELEALEQAKQKMTDMLVHDLKNNLAPIMMAVEMEKMETENPLNRSDFFQIIDQNSSRLILQINALMDLRKMQEGRMAIDKKLISPAAISRAVCEALSPAAKYYGLRLKVSLDLEHDTQIPADPLLMQRVLENLVWNAIKYGTSGSDVEIGCFAADVEDYRFEISNRGMTIPLEEQDSLFSAFSTGAKGRAGDKVSSTGLGLTFCKLAVEAHKGGIQFVSPWPAYGDGVGVVLTLPRNPADSVVLV